MSDLDLASVLRNTWYTVLELSNGIPVPSKRRKDYHVYIYGKSMPQAAKKLWRVLSTQIT